MVQMQERKWMWKRSDLHKLVCVVAHVSAYMKCAQNLTDMQCCPDTCVQLYILRRWRSKNRISRVDLLLTVSYSVSSSTPDRIPPFFLRPAPLLWCEECGYGNSRLCFDHEFCSFSWLRSMETWASRLDRSRQLRLYQYFTSWSWEVWQGFITFGGGTLPPQWRKHFSQG